MLLSSLETYLTKLLLLFKVIHQFAIHPLLCPLMSQTAYDEFILKSK